METSALGSLNKVAGLLKAICDWLLLYLQEVVLRCARKNPALKKSYKIKCKTFR